MGALSGQSGSAERLEWLDFGKAMGILVVLLVHSECRLGPITYFGGMFYMAVFFVAAGYTYRLRDGESYPARIKKRAVRLLVPYAGTSAFLWFFFWIKDCVLGGRMSDLKLHSILGILYSRNQMYASSYSGDNPVLLDLLNAPLWFLTAIFLTYAFYEFISRRPKVQRYILLGIGLAASVLWHYCTKLLLPWSLDAVPYFACFFAVGELLRERDVLTFLKRRWYWNLLLLVLFVFLSYLNGSVNVSCGEYGRSMIGYLAVGSTGSVLVFMAGAALERICMPLIWITGWVGQETLLILCFHMFLFMFIKTAAGILGFGVGLTQAALVTGSAVFLTAAGRFYKQRRRGRS